MNTQQLQCFLCVADKLNFTRAAEELYLTTPTVTHHIQSLESELNTHLFFRNRRTVQLTEAGRLFYQDARDIMDRFALAQRRLEDQAQRQSAILRLGCTSRGELPRLSRALARFRPLAPEVSPNLVVTDYCQMADLLAQRQLDLALASREMVAQAADYTFYTLARMETMVLLPAGDPLAGSPSLSLEQLAGRCVISLHPRLVPFQYGSRLQALLRRRSQSQPNITLESTQACAALAAAGYGAAILPGFALPERPEAQGLAAARLAEGDRIDYGAACRSGEDMGPAEGLLALLREELAGPG